MPSHTIILNAADSAIARAQGGCCRSAFRAKVRTCVLASVLIVLWNVMTLTACRAQTQPDTLRSNPTVADTSQQKISGAGIKPDSESEILFGSRSRSTYVAAEKELYLILTGGFGYSGQFWADGTYDVRPLPTAGVDFYAVPGGPVGFLLGGHAGFSPKFSYGIDLGVRLPIFGSIYDRERWYLDGQLLFYNGASDIFQTGGRLAIATAFGGPAIAEELRLVGEFRGQQQASSSDPQMTLFWGGIEAGISFSLVDQPKPLTQKDSIRAALIYIASSEELADFDSVSSQDLEGWLSDFWLKRESRIQGSDHDLEREFYSRMKIANARFSVPRRPGVESDPGRIIVIYGVPDNELMDYSVIDRGIQYIVWQYHQRIRGNSEAIVLFRSLNGAQWRQEYSNILGEPSGILPNDLPLSIYHMIQPFLR